MSKDVFIHKGPTFLASGRHYLIKSLDVVVLLCVTISLVSSDVLDLKATLCTMRNMLLLMLSCYIKVRWGHEGKLRQSSISTPLS
jgi:hypothetical protein